MSQYPVFSTSANIVTYARGRARLSANPPSDALKSTQLYVALHDINEEFVNYPSHIGALPFKYLRRETLILSKDPDELDGSIEAGATTIVLDDATDFDDPADTDVAGGYIKRSSWARDFFAYEDKSSDTLEVASEIAIEHSDAEEVHKIYQLPTNYGKPRKLFMDGSIPFEFEDMDFAQVPQYNRFTTKYLESTNGYLRTFLVLPEDIGEHDFTFYYIKRPNTIDNTGTVKVDAPDGNARKFEISRLEAYIWGIRGEVDLEAKCNAAADKAIAMFMDEQAMQTAEPEQDPSFDL